MIDDKTAQQPICRPDAHTVLRVIRAGQTYYECPKCGQVFMPADAE